MSDTEALAEVKKLATAILNERADMAASLRRIADKVESGETAPWELWNLDSELLSLAEPYSKWDLSDTLASVVGSIIEANKFACGGSKESSFAKQGDAPH